MHLRIIRCLGVMAAFIVKSILDDRQQAIGFSGIFGCEHPVAVALVRAVPLGTGLSFDQIDHTGKCLARKQIPVVFRKAFPVEVGKLFVMRFGFIQRVDIKRENDTFELFTFVFDFCKISSKKSL